MLERLLTRVSSQLPISSSITAAAARAGLNAEAFQHDSPILVSLTLMSPQAGKAMDG